MQKKMTIEEAAKHYGISKEAIHNRIRRGTLKAVIENNIKYVYIDPNTKERASRTNKTFSATATTGFNSFLQEQNRELQQKIEKLETETRRLREEKEQLLIEERKRIELIYKEKDEQLKNILNAISSKFLLEAKPLEEEEHFEAEIEEKKEPTIVSLTKFLKKHGLTEKKRKKIYNKVKKRAKKEERFIAKGSKIYLDLTSFDYQDLLSSVN